MTDRFNTIPLNTGSTVYYFLYEVDQIMPLWHEKHALTQQQLNAIVLRFWKKKVLFMLNSGLLKTSELDLPNHAFSSLFR